MRETRLIMGMPVTIRLVGRVSKEDIEDVFAYFTSVDERFSTYKPDSEVMRINRSEIAPEDYSPEMQEVLVIAEDTKKESDGYFDVKRPDGMFDPSGIVKGWAIKNAARLLYEKGYRNFFVDVGGDIQSYGTNESGEEWSVGIRNPFNREQIVKTLYPMGAGVATSGTYIRGAHIYNPRNPKQKLDEIVSLTVLGPDVLDADRFATAAFAMGKYGIHYVESLPDCEGYAIDARGMATMTSGLNRFITRNHTQTV